jgi:hypothetical protein
MSLALAIIRMAVILGIGTAQLRLLADFIMITAPRRCLSPRHWSLANVCIGERCTGVRDSLSQRDVCQSDGCGEVSNQPINLCKSLSHDLS